jgi:hypothetical protein
MSKCQELWVERGNLRCNKIVNKEIPKPAADQVLVAIDKFALTSNNVTYGLTGDTIGYWGYFPAEQQWGKIPVWACGNVIESHSDDIKVGERLWGFFPMSSHVILTPGKIRDDQFTDMADHRSKLPSLYNHYRRTAAEPEVLTQMENQRCLLFPLFATSFVLSDYLIHHDFFGAEQVIIGSASAKTAFGLAQLLSSNPKVSQKVIAVTSAGNEEFVRSLGIYDEVVLYNQENNLNASVPTAYVDMSGDKSLTTRIHNHIKENIVESCLVGATHWEEGGRLESLPGKQPVFFFAPGHIGKRDEELGKGQMMMRGMMAGVEMSTALKGKIDIKWIKTAEGLLDTWNGMLEHRINPKEGAMVSLL